MQFFGLMEFFSEMMKIYAPQEMESNWNHNRTGGTHIGHKKTASLHCVCICWVRILPFQQWCSHWSQENGFSPLCVLLLLCVMLSDALLRVRMRSHSTCGTLS